MTWVRVDDHFDEHPKHAQIGPLGWGVWLAGLAYCNRNLTDGFIPHSIARTLADFHVEDEHEGILWTLGMYSGNRGEDVTIGWIVGLLVHAELWIEVPGGYIIHDYGDYQPTKEQVEAAREQRRQAGQKGGLAKAKRPAKRLAKQTASEMLSEMPSKTLPRTRTRTPSSGTSSVSETQTDRPKLTTPREPEPDIDFADQNGDWGTDLYTTRIGEPPAGLSD